MKLKLALAQINTPLGDVEANLEKHLHFIDQACQEKADLLIFPELSLTGYVLQDLVDPSALRPKLEDKIFGELSKCSRYLDIMVGFVEEDNRHRFFIASAYLSGGEVVHVHHKVYLPTYDLFDEGRFFAWGDSVRAFYTRFGRLGMLICEDFGLTSALSFLVGWSRNPPFSFSFTWSWFGEPATIRVGPMGGTYQPGVCKHVHHFCGACKSGRIRRRSAFLGRIDSV